MVPHVLNHVFTHRIGKYRLNTVVQRARVVHDEERARDLDGEQTQHGLLHRVEKLGHRLCVVWYNIL